MVQGRKVTTNVKTGERKIIEKQFPEYVPGAVQGSFSIDMAEVDALLTWAKKEGHI